MPEATHEEEEPCPPTRRSGVARPGRILVAEDDGAMRDVVADTLVTHGYDVTLTSSGAALLDVMEAIDAGDHVLDGFDLVVLDHRMPVMTGLEVLKTLRARDPSTPVILMTSYPDPALRAEADRLDATVLPKPFCRNDLRSVVLAKLRGQTRLTSNR